MSELMELSASEIEEVGGGQTTYNFGPNVNISLQNAFIINPQIGVAVAVLSPGAQPTTVNWSLSGIGQFGSLKNIG